MRTIVVCSFILVMLLTVCSNYYPLPANTNLFLTSFLTIFVGSHRRLTQTESEKISSQEAYMFPVMGSCALFGLYVVFKMFDKDHVNLLLKFYFLLVGIFAIAGTLYPFAKEAVKRFVPSKLKRWTKTHTFERKWKVYQYVTGESFLVEGDLVTVACALIGATIAGWYVYSKHWCFNNIMGICFCIQGIENIGLGSVKVGIIILVRHPLPRRRPTHAQHI